MELLSSNLITIITAVIAIAVFLCAKLTGKADTIKLCAAWFMAEIACDGLTTGFSKYADAAEMVAYRYLYSVTALLFMIYVIKNKELFSKSIANILLCICVLSVLSGAYHWFFQSNWGSWGVGFYDAYSYCIDLIYFFSIVALEAAMLLLGFYSAMASICSAKRVRFKWR